MMPIVKSEEVKALECKLEALEADFQAFAYAVSHDVATPLRHIDGFARRLQKREQGSLCDESLNDLNVVLRSVGKCQKDLDAIKKYSRLATRFAPREGIDLNAILDSVTREYADKAAAIGAQIERQSLLPVYGDAAQLKELFSCLIDNALQYHSAEAKPAISISGQTDGAFQHISIRDNGIGIAQSQHEKVFVMFRRAVIPQEYLGQGCGLAYAKRIVVLHGGEISLTSAEAQGTTVSFSLPLDSGAPTVHT